MNPTQQNTKRCLIDTAYKLFTEKGYTNVSVQDICDVCSTTKPTFYKYINSKDALLTEFFAMDMEKELSQLNTIQDSKNRLLEGLALYIDRIETLGRPLSREFLMHCLEGQGPEKLIHPQLETYLQDTIVQGQEEGSIENKTDKAELLNLCMNTGLGMCYQWCFEGGFDLKNKYQEKLRLILRA
jgi:AcrR family transcriptional regulator